MLTVLLTASFLLVGSATAFALHRYLLNQLDQQLVAAGDRFSVGLEHPSDGDHDNAGQFNTVAGQAAGTLGARVVNGAVTAIDVVARRADQAAPSARDRNVAAGLGPTNRPRTVRFPDLGEYRVNVRRGQDGDLLITGLPERPVDSTTSGLLGIEAVVFGCALALTLGFGAASVRWSLRPLNKLAAAAHGVSTLPLSTGLVSLPKRVDVAAPDTEAGEVASAFNHMLDHVESALHVRQASEERLRHFLADASHELRTPVAVVRSQAEYAQRIGAEAIPEPVAEALDRIVAESDRMGHLVTDLLLLARLDSGRQLEYAPTDLTRLVLDAVSDARVLSRDHAWRLDLPESELVVEGDERALHQVVTNLLTNARIHTPPGTTVTAKLRLADSGDAVTLTVSDDGPGIPANIRDHLFDRFVRADVARSRPEGSGLGLAIVEAIVTAHGGTAQVHSEAGATIFTVTLPQTHVDH